MKKNSAKTLWYILFAVIAVALCYLFVVVYFFFFLPYSISSKTTVWPFLSDMAVGELCLDATVEIDFTVVEEDNFNEKVEHKIVGVNIRKDGFVVAPYSDLRNADPDSPIRIYANSGEIFEGVVLYGDMNYNLAILKCESLNENGLVALPYVEIAGVSNKVYFDSRVIMVGSPVGSGEIVINDVTDHNLVCGIETEIDGNFAIEYVLEYCFTTRVGLNDTLETAAVSVIQTGHTAGVRGLILAREFDVENNLDFLTITLPSKRKLYYANPALGENQWNRPSILYRGVNQTTKQWSQLETYGGKLVENVVQAIARDCLATAIENLEAAGFPVVFHVHDEVVIDCPLDKADLDEVVRIMTRAIPWAPDLPLNADGWVGDFFRKD